jgi:hypothetical protein
MIEINIGIWCASIPALKALVSKSQRLRAQGSHSNGYHYHGSERSAERPGEIGKSADFVMLEETRGASVGGSQERIVGVGERGGRV